MVLRVDEHHVRVAGEAVRARDAVLAVVGDDRSGPVDTREPLRRRVVRRARIHARRDRDHLDVRRQRRAMQIVGEQGDLALAVRAPVRDEQHDFRLPVVGDAHRRAVERRAGDGRDRLTYRSIGGRALEGGKCTARCGHGTHLYPGRGRAIRPGECDGDDGGHDQDSYDRAVDQVALVVPVALLGETFTS